MRSGSLWVIVGLLLVLLVVPPFVMGFGIERVYAQLVREASGQADATYTIEGQLDRGWLVSRAQTVIRQRAGIDATPYEFVLHHDIVHGPVPLGELFFGRSPLQLVAAVVDTRFEADPERLEHFAEALAGRPLLRLMAWLHLDRSARLELHSPQLALSDGRFVSQGVEGHADLDPAEGALDSRVRFGPFALVGEAGEVRLAESRFQIQGTPGELGTAVSGRLELGAIELRGPLATRHIEPSRLDFSAVLAGTELVEDAVDLWLGDYRIEATGETQGMLRALTGLRVEERLHFAPETGLRDLELTLRFDRLEGDRRFDTGELKLRASNIDSEAIQGFRTAVARIDAQAPPDSDTSLLKAEAFEEWAPQVLGPAPELALERLSLESDAGPIRADFRLGIDASDPSMLANPFMVMALIQAELNLEVPAVVMREWLADQLFCTAPVRSIDEVDATTGKVSTRRVAAPAPLPPPVMARLWDGYRVDQSAAEASEIDVDGALRASGFRCQPIFEKMVADGILLPRGTSLVTNVRVEETLPFVNDSPRPELLVGVVPDM